MTYSRKLVVAFRVVLLLLNKYFERSERNNKPSVLWFSSHLSHDLCTEHYRRLNNMRFIVRVAFARRLHRKSCDAFLTTDDDYGSYIYTSSRLSGIAPKTERQRWQ